jgi:hypothetical protein
MPAFLVEADPNDVATRINNVDTAVVFAADEDDALAMVKSQFDGDGDGSWDAATVTEIAAAADLAGFRMRIRIAPPPAEGGPDIVDVSYTGLATDNMDDFGAALVTALNATAPIAGAAYVTATQVLTIAQTTDALGDHTVLIELLPPGTLPGSVAVPGGVISVTDEGSAASALTATLAADAYVVPQLMGLFRARS